MAAKGLIKTLISFALMSVGVVMFLVGQTGVIVVEDAFEGTLKTVLNYVAIGFLFGAIGSGRSR